VKRGAMMVYTPEFCPFEGGCIFMAIENSQLAVVSVTEAEFLAKFTKVIESVRVRPISGGAPTKAETLRTEVPNRRDEAIRTHVPGWAPRYEREHFEFELDHTERGRELLGLTLR
jgi:hypothetical protein